MTNRQYLIEIVTIKVHTISESTPSALCEVNCPPVACTTVCREYKGLVPRSPKTTPKALNVAHRPDRAGRCAAGIDSRVPRLLPGGRLFYGIAGRSAGRRSGRRGGGPRVGSRCRHRFGDVGIVGRERHRGDHAIRFLKYFPGVVPV